MRNILNLVFENWQDGRLALPNGNELFKNSLVLPKFIKTNELFEVKFNILTNVNVYDNFYFVICHRVSLVEYISQSYDNFISNEVKVLVRSKNLKIIFVQEHESEYNIKNTITLLDMLCVSNHLDPSNFYIICNNAEIDSYTQFTKINLNKIEFLSEWAYRALTPLNPKFVTNKLGKFALLHNRTPRTHRIILLALLKKNNILENFDWSIIDGFRKKVAKGEILSKSSIDNIKHEMEFFDKIDVKKSDYELNTNWFDTTYNVEFHKAFMLDSYENSYINVVTESYFWETEIHITEKAFKPFYFFQLPIFVSSCGYVKKLKELYGFDVFDDLINHSYDNEFSAEKRMLMIVSELISLVEKKSDVIEFYKNNQNRFIANQNIIKNIKNNNNVNKLLLTLTKTHLHKKTLI
jgi:hypothetical protein